MVDSAKNEASHCPTSPRVDSFNGKRSFPYLTLKILTRHNSKRNPTFSCVNEQQPFLIIPLQRSHLGDKGVLISAYNLFQRVAIGLELVKRDLETSTSEEYVTKKGSYWKLAFEAANRVVEAVFLGLKSRGHNAENLAVLKRDIVLPAAACATSEAMRDLRDWVILSNSIQIVQAYKQLFGMYARNRHLAN